MSAVIQQPFIERRKNRPDAPLPPFQLERREVPRETTLPVFVAGAVDPDLSRPSRTISPGKMLVLLGLGLSGILACEGPVHDFLVKYNDNIVAILMGFFPALVVVVVMGGRRILNFWRANLKFAADMEAQRRAQMAAARASAKLTEPDLHILPFRPTSHTRAA